jgi:hypothetical protein
LEGRHEIVGGSSSSLNKSNPKLNSKSNGNLRAGEKRPTDKLSNDALANANTQKKGAVFDRLTSVSGYTGTHKLRFNEDGTGKGIAGRDAVSKGAGSHGTYHGGDVKDLSQILRQ